jgi:hypothetical protein
VKSLVIKFLTRILHHFGLAVVTKTTLQKWKQLSQEHSKVAEDYANSDPKLEALNLGRAEAYTDCLQTIKTTNTI